MLVDPPDSDNSDLDEDEEQREVRIQKNKANLLKWVTEADFAQDFNILQLADHPFELEENEST